MLTLDAQLWALFVSSFIASTLLPAGSEIGLVWLLNEGQIATWKLLCVAIIGNSLGGVLTFYLGMIIARYYPAKKLLSIRQVKSKQWLQARGPLVLLLSWLPLIGDPLCLLAGWLRLNIALCCVYIVIGKAMRYLLISAFFV